MIHLKAKVSRSPSQRWGMFGILIVAAWFTMTVMHELGHVVGGWISGGTLVDLVLFPLPSSLHQPDPIPRLTLWAGPVLGVGVPSLFAAVVRHHAGWFIADFCALANGTYLLVAWYAGERLLDTPRLFAAGESPLVVATFCALTIGIGYPRFRGDCILLLTP